MISVSLPDISGAEQKTIVKEYSYEAGELDSKVSSRIMAMTQIKRLVLEEAGTYVSGTAKVNNFELQSDQIDAVTAGIVGLKVVAEAWDGRVFYMKAEATIDPDDVAKKLDSVVRNQGQIKELESAQQRIDELAAEVENLKSGMQAMQKQGRLPDQSGQTQDQTGQQEYVARYNDAVAQMRSLDMVQNSYVYINSGNYQTAVSTLNSAIALSALAAPTAYIARSIVYVNLNTPDKAVADLNTAARLNPTTGTRVALTRAFMYERSGNRDLAMEEVNRAIRMDPREPAAYRQRARLYLQAGNREKGLEDMRQGRKLYELRHQEFIKARQERQRPGPALTIVPRPVSRPEQNSERPDRKTIRMERAEQNRLAREKQLQQEKQRRRRIEQQRQGIQQKTQEKEQERLRKEKLKKQLQEKERKEKRKEKEEEKKPEHERERDLKK